MIQRIKTFTNVSEPNKVSRRFIMVHFARYPPLWSIPMNEPVCLNCNRTGEQIPLLNLTFKGEAKYICAQCFPILIHKIHLLADKLPGVEIPPPAA